MPVFECPVFSMAAPKDGCYYENTKDEKGCDHPVEVCAGVPGAG